MIVLIVAKIETATAVVPAIPLLACTTIVESEYHNVRSEGLPKIALPGDESEEPRLDPDKKKIIEPVEGPLATKLSAAFPISDLLLAVSICLPVMTKESKVSASVSVPKAPMMEMIIVF